MNQFLQINLHCAKAAQDLMCQYAAEEAIDYIFVSEYNNLGNQHWYPDNTGKAAIVCNPSNTITDIGQSENGFRWIEVDGMTLYSCYWSPNTSLQEFKQFLSLLETDVRRKTTETLIAGDFNAWHTTWGARYNNARGEALLDMISSLGMIICNRGNALTFQRGNSESIVDLTLVSHGLSTLMTNWRVSDVISLSDHDYIRFDTQTRNQDTVCPQARTKKHRINLKKLVEILEKGNLINTDQLNVEECATTLAEKLRESCGVEIDGRTGKRKSVKK